MMSYYVCPFVTLALRYCALLSDYTVVRRGISSNNGFLLKTSIGAKIMICLNS